MGRRGTPEQGPHMIAMDATAGRSAYISVREFETGRRRINGHMTSCSAKFAFNIV